MKPERRRLLKSKSELMETRRSSALMAETARKAFDMLEIDEVYGNEDKVT